MTLIREGFQSADLDIPVVLPTLNLDFANSQSLDERITFSRGSIGTFVNKNGLIETAAANIPRFDYDPISGECRGLLIEESRQNLVTYSEDFSNAVWGRVSSGIVTNTIATLAPDGTYTAEKLIENTTKDNHYIYSLFKSTANTRYTISVFVKSAERTKVRIAWAGAYYTTGSASMDYDLSLGTASVVGGSQGSSTASIVSFPNGWYRCIASSTVSNATTSQLPQLLLLNSSGTQNYQGDGTSGIYIWGAQVEAGTFPTSYIPTSGSTVTRSAELVEMTGTNFSSWYNQSEGTFFLDGTLPFITNDSISSGARVPFGVSNGFSFANSMYVAKGNTSLALSFSVVSNSLGQTGAVTTTMTSSRFKISAAFADRNIYSCGYGGTVNKSIRPSASIPTVTRLTLGREPWNVGVSNPIIGCIRKFAYYPKALSPSQLQYLTQ